MSPRSVSPQVGSKRPHTTDDESDDDIKEARVHVNKTLKLEKRSGRPKAGDYDEAGMN